MYNTYSPPRGFCFDLLCSDEPIIDDKKSPDYNVDRRVSIMNVRLILIMFLHKIISLHVLPDYGFHQTSKFTIHSLSVKSRHHYHGWGFHLHGRRNLVREFRQTHKVGILFFSRLTISSLIWKAWHKYTPPTISLLQWARILTIKMPTCGSKI